MYLNHTHLISLSSQPAMAVDALGFSLRRFFAAHRWSKRSCRFVPACSHNVTEEKQPCPTKT